jgi:SAM-dependent methyltransferase
VSSKADREREFHNVVFSEHTRAPLAKFYEVQRPAFERYEALLARASSGSRALEYGCGPGSYAYFLARRGVEVTGIDISDVAIDQARERAEREGLADRCTFEVMDAEHLDLPADAFDLVCGSAILHHLDLRLALDEIARVLRKGGGGVFLEALGHNPLINLYRRLTPRYRTPDEHPLRSEDLELARARFETVELDHFGLTTLLAVPLRRRPSFRRVVRRLDRVDQALFRIGPAQRLAWSAVIRLADPRPRG